MSDLRVSGSLLIPEAELQERFITSGGPGGQHANRSATKVELAWNVRTSTVLGDRQRRLLLSRLKNRIDRDGTLRVVASSSRSQLRNRREAEQRLAKIVGAALRVPKHRVPTRPTKAAQERRLREKKRRAGVKQARRKPEL